MLFTAPKVWGFREVLDKDDLNALAAAIAASVNNVVDAQIADDANIQGTRIAQPPNGLTGAKFENGAIQGGDLSAGVAAVAAGSNVSVAGVTLDATWQDLATVTRTVLGGFVCLVGIVTYKCTFTATESTRAEFRLDKGGSPLGSSFVEIPMSGQNTEVRGGSIVIPYLEQVGAGSVTWKMQGNKHSYGGTWYVESCQLWAWEWR